MSCCPLDVLCCGLVLLLCWAAVVVVPSRSFSAITSDGSASSNLGAWSKSSRQTMHCSAMLINENVWVVADGGLCEEHKVTFRYKLAKWLFSNWKVKKKRALIWMIVRWSTIRGMEEARGGAGEMGEVDWLR